MIIQYYRKIIQGEREMYIQNSRTRDILSYLTGRKILNEVDMVALKGLGHEFEEIPTPNKERLPE
mgnify:CR=1 FL=1|jgi:hypothetical protein|tara:strand:- start:8186 stop:8380 length:195 start_codon:yes stop_codon:yes gene_type:complete